MLMNQFLLKLQFISSFLRRPMNLKRYRIISVSITYLPNGTLKIGQLCLLFAEIIIIPSSCIIKYLVVLSRKMKLLIVRLIKRKSKGGFLTLRNSLKKLRLVRNVIMENASIIFLKLILQSAVLSKLNMINFWRPR
jgi:hypothetical protein